MKIGIFGGTFNPIHKGHINLCDECYKLYNFDKILLIPTNTPPHKEAKNLASNDQRLEMINLSVKEYPTFTPCDIEYKLEGKSYTINTITALKQLYPNDQLYLIIGSDMFYMFEKWNRYQEILKNVTLIVGAREFKEYDELIKKKSKFNELSDKIDIAILGVKPMSSTQIREMLQKRDKVVKGYLNPDVYNYIIDNNLYLGD